jgi:hypothetical protein
MAVTTQVMEELPILLFSLANLLDLLGVLLRFLVNDFDLKLFSRNNHLLNALSTSTICRKLYAGVTPLPVIKVTELGLLQTGVHGAKRAPQS